MTRRTKTRTRSEDIEGGAALVKRLYALFLIDGTSFALYEAIRDLSDRLGALTGKRIKVRAIGNPRGSDPIYLASLPPDRVAALFEGPDRYFEEVARTGGERKHVIRETAKVGGVLGKEPGGPPCLVFVLPGSREVIASLPFDADWYSSEERRRLFLNEIMRWFKSRTLADTLEQGIDPDILRLRLRSELELLETSIDAAITANSNRKASGLRGPVRLDLPKGTTWSAITIARLDDQRVRVSVGQRTWNLNYTQLGMVDTRTGELDKQWELLQEILKAGGTLSWSDAAADPKNQKRKELLARALKRALSLDEDPFEVVVYEANGKRRKAWKARFNVPPPGHYMRRVE